MDHNFLYPLLKGSRRQVELVTLCLPKSRLFKKRGPRYKSSLFSIFEVFQPSHWSRYNHDMKNNQVLCEREASASLIAHK